MDCIEVLVGEGTGISKGGETRVEYQLGVYQHQITVGSDDTVPVEKEVRGWIRPIFGAADEVLTLEFNDLSTLRFSFRGGDGKIAARGSVMPFPA